MNFLDFSNNIVGGVRNIMAQISDYFDTRPKIFKKRGPELEEEPWIDEDDEGSINSSGEPAAAALEPAVAVALEPAVAALEPAAAVAVALEPAAAALEPASDFKEYENKTINPSFNETYSDPVIITGNNLSLEPSKIIATSVEPTFSG